MPRLIMHVDLDAFYAAVEQRDHPQWRGFPVVVGAEPGRRGVVATCSVKLADGEHEREVVRQEDPVRGVGSSIADKERSFFWVVSSSQSRGSIGKTITLQHAPQRTRAASENRGAAPRHRPAQPPPARS